MRSSSTGTPARSLGRALVTACALVLAAVSLGTGDASGSTGDWTSYLFGPRHGSRNAETTAITPDLVPTLAPDWTFTADPPTEPDQPPNAFAASPTVADGRVFIGANTGMFYALDETDGSVLWSRSLGYVTPKSCLYGRGITSTAAVAWDASRGESVVYVGGGDGFLYALAADDGAILWRSPVVQTGTTENTGYNWASPLVVNGSVFMGVSSLCDRPLVRGGLKRSDQATGERTGTYWTVPKSSVGGSVWTSPASKGPDMWITTGNSQVGDAPGDSFALVRLSASTLEKRERWVVPGADKDLDWGSSPAVFSATLSGKVRTLVGACSKNGRFYALRATDLSSGPVWSRRLGQAAGSSGSCLAAAIWDPSAGRLVTGGNATTIGGVDYPGSLRALDPADGTVVWATPLTGGPVMGSPTMNGAGVVAAGTYNRAAPSSNAVYLVDASDGSILRTLAMDGPVFSQPVFAGTHLFVASTDGVLTAWAPA